MNCVPLLDLELSTQNQNVSRRLIAVAIYKQLLEEAVEELVEYSEHTGKLRSVPASCCKNGNMDLGLLADPPASLKESYDDSSVISGRIREQLEDIILHSLLLRLASTALSELGEYVTPSSF
ncbi:unnamed protein product [Rhizopus stolonifer]